MARRITSFAGRRRCSGRNAACGEKTNSAVADVETRFHAGELPWNYGTVQSLIGDYPRRRQLDVILPGQEDEATPDQDGVPWNDPDASDDDPDDDPDVHDDDHILEYDPKDWVEPPRDPSGDHGNGEGQPETSGEMCIHGDGATLSAEQASLLQERSTRLQALQEADRIFASIDGAVGVSLRETVRKVMQHEEKKFRQRILGDAAVDKAMRDVAEAEEAAARRQRAEFQAACQRKRDSEEAEVAVKAATEKLKKLRKEHTQLVAQIENLAAIKSYSLEALGKGKKNGGTAQYQKARHEALKRLRAISPLTPEQQNDWHFSPPFRLGSLDFLL